MFYLTPAERKYLLIVFLTLNEMGWTRLKKISDYAKVKMPSAKQSLDSLAKKGLIYYEKRGAITLTKEGKKIAVKENENIQAVKKFFTEIMLIPSDKADEAVWKIYFEMAEEVVEKFVLFAKFMNQCPMEKPVFIGHFKEFLNSGNVSTECPFLNKGQGGN
ncbi:metal-dependent transcriptional regulator [Thermosipho atlanticus]|uniref:Iron (Metal) dependent repressor, DtxR family n=1 Tax=Thermosipho atlanticus DSM 15807 TaxID=1123380 RepID=A0A1M5SQH2_9BACT|nr:metal-dependent transcriptional regulator [Thermosipho atlanticus]SHH40690.1 iron (metal) dependent repressor, DtxR family [Thermosipho atlanticus DSM 15807]